MHYDIDVLRLGTATLDSSFFLRGRARGVLRTVPVFAFLLRARSASILVDTGMRSPEMLTRLGMGAEIPADQRLDAQLARFSLTPADIGLIVQTHLHADHGGGIRLFPPDTRMVMNRSELEFAEHGTQGLFYPPEDIAEVRDRSAGGAVRFLELETSGPVEAAPGLVCEHARGHTPGMMFVRAATHDGIATICSDVVYDVGDQLIEPMSANGQPEISNNTTWGLEDERAAITRALVGTDYLLPSHCRGARVRNGRVIGLLNELRVPCGHAPGPGPTPGRRPDSLER